MPDQRKLFLAERPDFVGWSCSHCDWVFHIPANLKSGSLDDLIRQAEAIRDAAFGAHHCSNRAPDQTMKRARNGFRVKAIHGQD
jgi:hypothetical protein